MQSEPGALPSALTKESVILWGSPSEDLGPRKFGIISVSGESKKRSDSALQDLARPVKSRKKAEPSVTKKSPKKIAKVAVRGK
jgi:hypothetical protein